MCYIQSGGDQVSLEQFMEAVKGDPTMEQALQRQQRLLL